MAPRASLFDWNRKGKSTMPRAGNAVGEIAARLIAEGQEPVLDQPQYVLGAVSEIHDVPDILDVDVLAELRCKAIADHLEREAEAGRGRAIAPHADLKRTAHACDLVLAIGASRQSNMTPHGLRKQSMRAPEPRSRLQQKIRRNRSALPSRSGSHTLPFGAAGHLGDVRPSTLFR
jgi:hypothetical protein